MALTVVVVLVEMVVLAAAMVRYLINRNSNRTKGVVNVCCLAKHYELFERQEENS